MHLTPLKQGSASATAPRYHVYSTTGCSDCPLREQCTKSKVGRQVKRYEGDELKEALIQVMDQPAAKKRFRQRKAMVEPVFSHLKMRQNLNRFRRKGLAKVRLEFMLHVMAYNISRAIAQSPANRQ